MAGKSTLVRAVTVLAVGVLIAVAGLTSAPARGAHALAQNSLSLPDPVGDVRGEDGPDISSVAVTDDGKLATFTVTTVDPLPDYGVVAVLFDADRDPTTGQGGLDEMVGAALQPEEFASVFVVWNGSSWQEFEPEGSDVDVSGNVTTFRIALPDMFGTGAFRFQVETMMFDSDGFPRSLDLAPDSDLAQYAFTGASLATSETTKAAVSRDVQLGFGPTRVAPSPVRAGHRATITFTLQAGKGVAVGKPVGAVCKVTIGGKPIAHTTRLGNGAVVVSVSVPKTAHGKRLVVSVNLDGLTSRTVSYPVR